MNLMFLFDTPINPSVGGVQRVTEVLSKEFISRGHKVIFVAYAFKYMMLQKPSAAPQFYIDYKNQSIDKTKLQINKIVNDNNIDIIISQSFSNNFMLKMIDKKIGIISVCHTQPFLTDNWTRKDICKIVPKNFKQKVFKYLSLIFPKFFINHTLQSEINDTEEAFRISDYVCYISNRFFHRLNKHLTSYPEEKLIAINNPNSFDKPVIDGKKENLIIWVGRVNIQGKNTLDFVKMWRLLQRQKPEWHAEIIGYGRDFDVVKEYIERYSINNIKLVGRKDNVEDYYKRAKIVAVTSMSESWCLSITEGMMYGCVPCVYDTFETIRDLIEPNETGLIVPPNPTEMAMALNDLCNNEEEIMRLSSNAKANIVKYNVKPIADEWEKLFMKIINNN